MGGKTLSAIVFGGIMSLSYSREHIGKLSKISEDSCCENYQCVELKSIGL